MMFRSAFLLLAVLPAATLAFQPAITFTKQPLKTRSSSHLSLSNNKKNEDENLSKKNLVANLALAGTVFATSFTGLVAPLPAHAGVVELSEGAIIIQTSTKPGQSLLQTRVDAKDLFGTLIKNRKALKESLGRIATAVKEELNTPAWQDLGRLVLQIEDDVAPEIRVGAPRDIQQTVKDIAQGKLNLIVNGEIINLSIDATSSAAEGDEVVLRAKGVKGNLAMPMLQEPEIQAAVRTRLQDQIDTFRAFWNQEIELPRVFQEEVPEGTKITMGDAITSGSILGIGSLYGISYAYYLSQQEEAAANAEAQRKMVAERKKKAAEIAAKKKAREQEGASKD
jgi:hypothetical protein